jgi:hypothetical protein
MQSHEQHNKTLEHNQGAHGDGIHRSADYKTLTFFLIPSLFAAQDRIPQSRR